jgi:hypothetical protein
MPDVANDGAVEAAATGGFVCGPIKPWVSLMRAKLLNYGYEMKHLRVVDQTGSYIDYDTESVPRIGEGSRLASVLRAVL